MDITASKERKPVNFKKIGQIASEAFMPMSYGGGITNFEDAQKIFDAGFEKVIISTAAEDHRLLEQISKSYGSQSVGVSIDTRRNWLGKNVVYKRSGSDATGKSPEKFAQEVAAAGAGEIIVHSIQKDGTWSGYDLPIIQSVSEAVNIPVIALGGASGMEDFKKAIEAGASAVAAGSCFVYQKKGMGVLLSFPQEVLRV